MRKPNVRSRVKAKARIRIKEAPMVIQVLMVRRNAIGVWDRTTSKIASGSRELVLPVARLDTVLLSARIPP